MSSTGYDMPTTVYIWPNCSLETIDTISPIPDFEYQTKTGVHIVTVPVFGTSLPMCDISSYWALVNGSDVSSSDPNVNPYIGLFTFDPTTREFSVDINDNLYAGNIYNVTVLGNNTGNVNGSSTFFITVIINCGFATLSVAEHAAVTGPQYFNYTVNSGPIGLYTLVGTSDDAYCKPAYSFSFSNGTQVESNTSLSNAIFFDENSIE